MIVVPLAQPPNEGQHFGVAPHPRGKALEAREGRARVRIGTFAANKPVDAKCVGPVGFDDDGCQPVMFDQVLRDARAQMAKILRSARRLTEQNDAR